MNISELKHLLNNRLFNDSNEYTLVVRNTSTLNIEVEASNILINNGEKK